MQFLEEVKATLWKLIDEMSLNVSEFTVHPEKDFTRKKKWDFPTLIKFIISMESQSLKNELHKYLGYTTDCPSTASFNQRRAQIRAEAFQSLFTSFTSKNPNLFKGYRLIACDGSDINIAHNPSDKETYFKNGNARGFNQLHLNAMYDLLNKIYTDVIIQPGKIENEHKAFCDMVDRYNGMPKLSLLLTEAMNHITTLHMYKKKVLFICSDAKISVVVEYYRV